MVDVLKISPVLKHGKIPASGTRRSRMSSGLHVELFQDAVPSGDRLVFWDQAPGATPHSWC